MDPAWIKRLRKNLRPRAIAFDKPKIIDRRPHSKLYLENPPPGFMEWDKEALNEIQQSYITDQIADILKKNKEYLYYHPQVIGILILLIRSFAKYQPRDVRKHMKQVLQDTFLPAKVNLFLKERGFKKSQQMEEHDEETMEDWKDEQKHYEGQKKYIECFRSELPMPESTVKCFRKSHWKEPYPDYIIKKSKTLRYTLPHYIKHNRQFYPLKPPF
ncbi:hypothetical protein O3M35_001149 [Rhynocoris fuscipes]|uniref:Uncharacterized protein n=1 Tax=Rhynocoris fuscipes TaxID=488301 RepID=A0AAW1DQ96_9HEMI